MHSPVRGRRPGAGRRRFLPAALRLPAAVVLSAAVTAACGPAQGGATGAPGASGGPVAGATDASGDPFTQPTAPGAVVVFCVDVSSSYPVPARKQARAAVAKALPSLVVPGRKESSVYVYTIGVNTYQDPPSAQLSIPALDEKPASAAGNNAPLQGAKVSAQVGDFEKQWKARQSQALAGAGAAAARLNALSVSASEPGTDIGGCLKNASEQFSGRPHGTPLYLVIASDLAPDGTQQQSHAPIPGVRVWVVDFTCDQAVACDKRKASWVKKLTGLGASSVSVTRPGYDGHLLDGASAAAGGARR